MPRRFVYNGPKGPKRTAKEEAPTSGKVRIKQVRSGIGHSWRMRRTLEAMGRAAGYSVLESETSPDGGVISTILKKGTATESVESRPGNYEHVAETLFWFTTKDFYLTANPYKRPLLKLRRSLGERRAVKGAANGQAVLDAIIEGAFGNAAVNRNGAGASET